MNKTLPSKSFQELIDNQSDIRKSVRECVACGRLTSAKSETTRGPRCTHCEGVTTDNVIYEDGAVCGKCKLEKHVLRVCDNGAKRCLDCQPRK